MKRILILYPALFTCKTKFERKVSHLTHKLEHVEFIYIDDPNHFISAMAASAGKNSSKISRDTISTNSLDYAIVFDDNEEFPKERELLAKIQIPTRWIRIALTRVININRDDNYHSKNSKNFEYIGRGSYWGNPHAMQETGEDRREVIRKYHYDFHYDKFIRIKPERVHELTGKRLGCFCKPAACHGDVLADFLNSYDDGN